MLLWAATPSVDRLGARLEVALVGTSLLLTARSRRHGVGRRELHLAGLTCWGALAWSAAALGLGVLGLGALMVRHAVAGRSRPRPVWSPRVARSARAAEIATAVSGSSALAVVVVASGLFRHVWELTS
jgi:hypothetical protein